MIVPRYYEDLRMLHDNTMPARAYYIPASQRREDLTENRENSDRLQLLNGEWDFKYFESIYEVKEAFYEISYDAWDFDRVSVPGVWQMDGYDGHQYINIRYPFPFDPPYVPQDIPCGAYVHTFSYQKDERAPKAFLNFEGVDSCFYVWMNGVYVGYSQVSHASSEFDVTSLLLEGENKLAVLALKWCDGSYLEDQDKFRMSGIFRDVYLLKRPRRAVRDYRVTTKISEGCAAVTVDISFSEPADTKVTIEDKYGAAAAEGRISADGKLELTVLYPVLWNTENPYLYTLILAAEDEVIVDHIGFRTIEIRENVIYFNGEKIKFRGVNRHDSDPETGFAVSPKQIKADLILMKQHNFNAIRSSHYPNAPYFYQMCDKYGFMVIDEADIEAHGPFMLYRREDTDYNRFHRWNEKIADDPAWEEAVLDRVQLMIERDKNRPCIVMWSMGNESAYGCNFEKALEWTKKFDPDRLTQYESARYRNYSRTYNYENLDLYSRMYPSLTEISEYLERDGSKPFLLVEYCHSMGNGPGDLEDYFQMIHSDDRMCGGFVWEWCDHAIAHGMAENGKIKYHYGGDHGEEIHDGNFCMDGLVYPDRRPHTGLLEYKNVYRPARVVSYNQDSGELTFHNYMDFDYLKDYAEISYEMTQDGLAVERGILKDVPAAPHSDGKAELNLRVPASGKVYLKLTYRLKKDLPLLERGHVLGFDEIKLENEDGRNRQAVKWLEQKSGFADIAVKESDTLITLQARDFSYRLDKRTGMFTQLQFAGRDYLNHPMELNIWRAPTDNDRYLKEEWKKAGYDRAGARAYGIKVVQKEYGVQITEHLSVAAAAVQKILDVELIWEIDGNGRISSIISAAKEEEFPELPRFGIRLFLNQKLENISYFGMGPQESYRDKHQGSSHGCYHSKVSQMHEDYIRPQENGSHFDCDYVEAASAEFGIAAVSEQPFSFQASVYTQEELERAAHNYELKEADSTVLCIDYALNGIGSNSCGPAVLERYRFDDTAFRFQFALALFAKER
ncbi:MAG: DUF4981 domain-containing protein [Lachnospiraceae bacterium]|nr:DUF4981 domain-containing protein [Lachnospiraceae bacterium]